MSNITSVYIVVQPYSTTNISIVNNSQNIVISIKFAATYHAPDINTDEIYSQEARNETEAENALRETQHVDSDDLQYFIDFSHELGYD
jgi:hypothetical protein